MSAGTNGSHKWKFFRAGGFDQVRLESGADVLALDQLDQKLWVALACPAQGLEFDSKTLALIDTDKDGRIRVPEIISAAKWTIGCLRNPDDIVRGNGALPLTSINEGSPEGKQLLASARQILDDLGKKDATVITADDTADTTKIFAQTNFNGDGIVTADSASDEPAKSVITDIIGCLGADTDRSGKPGVNQAKVDQFFVECQACADWWKMAEANSATLPLGDGTAFAWATFAAVKAKVDDYFARCRLAAFDTRALSALNRQESEYLAVAAKDMSLTAAEVSCFPLARVEAGKALPLVNGVNPAWATALAKLQIEVVKPLLGARELLTEADWLKINDRFAGYQMWLAAKAGSAVEKLGLQRVRQILESKAKDSIAALIQRDKALEPQANSIAAVDKLVRFHRDLFKLLNNFVAFREFYGQRDKAIFQAGTLYLDQRSCDLCLRVEDPGKHAAMSALAGTYLAYCDCVRKSTGEKMQIAAAFTAGDSDFLMVGRNGIFYDRQGRDWDATIVKIIDNPISLRQAFWLPYKRVVRMIEEQVAKRAAAADAAAQQSLNATATTAANIDKAKPVEPKKMDAGVVAAIGVALGALGTAVSALVTGLLKLPAWQMPLVFLGLLLVVSGPSLVIAALKLRKRTLGPILDANGWAVNARAKINIPFGTSLTRVAALPLGAERDLFDPYAESHSTRNKAIALIVLLAGLWAAWNFGLIEKAIPNTFPKSGWMNKRETALRTAASEPSTALSPTPSAPVKSP